MIVQAIPTRNITDYWAVTSDLLADNKMPDYTLDDLKTRLLNGRLALAVAVDADTPVGACIFGMLPNKTVHIFELGGRGVATQEAFAQLCDIFRAQGAVKVQAAAQPAAARLYARLGMHPKYTVVGTDL